MRALTCSALALAATLLLAIHPASQGSGPTKKPTPPEPPSECFELRFARVPGVDFRWARIRTGDKWISGCLGVAAECYVAVWVRC
jgi:hypothetical protein